MRELTKVQRKAARKAFGEDGAFFAFECWNILAGRGFWGRMKWLVFGK